MILKIAFRNTLRQKRRSVLTLLTMVGGFVLASVSIGWSDGTYAYVIKMFTDDRLGQIEIHSHGYLDRPSLFHTIENYRTVGQTLQAVGGVRSWAPRVFSAGLACFNDKTTAVQLIGIDPELEEKATGFSRKIVSGEPWNEAAPRSVFLGKNAARILDAAPGDSIVLVTQAADGSLANDVFPLGGIVETGDEASDLTSLFIRLDEVQRFLALEGRVHEIAVMVHRLEQVQAITMALRRALRNSSLEIQPWQEFARSFYEAMRADQMGMWIMLFVIILVVAVSVFNTVLMSVLERRREYGLLKALGTRPLQIIRLVLCEVLLVALGGVAVGIGLCAAINGLLSIRGIPMPTAVTFGGVRFDRMYTEVTAGSLLIPAVTVILSAILVGVGPALTAAKTKAAKAMKTF